MRTTLLAIGCLASSTLAQPTTITAIGPVSAVHAISGDGSTVVGAANGQAFRWSQSSGLVLLGTLPGGASSSANAVSVDGSTIVGASISSQRTEAFRWTLAAGMQGLGTLAPTEMLSIATGVSGDGEIVVGRASASAATAAFRWTAQTGMQTLSCGTPSAAATGISADGSTVIGNGWGAGPSITNAFAWRNGNCIIAPSTQTTLAVAVSSSGNVVVGAIGNNLARWHDGVPQAYQMPGAIPQACSADAMTIVGTALGVSFISQPNSARTLHLVLSNLYGLDLSAWSNLEVAAISADARTITGRGLHQGQVQGWVVQLGKPVCYANCDGSTVEPILNVADFSCFLQRYAAGHVYGQCDGTLFGPITQPDFSCWLGYFAMGCP
jgi:uncharacterized membrane protein